MKKHKALLLPQKLLVASNGLGIALVLGAFQMQYFKGNVDVSYLLVGLVFASISFFCVVVDLTRNEIKKKIQWSLLLLLFSFFASFFYLLLRKRLLE